MNIYKLRMATADRAGDMPRFKKAVEQHYRNRMVYEWLRGVKNVAMRFVKNQKGR